MVIYPPFVGGGKKRFGCVHGVECVSSMGNDGEIGYVIVTVHNSGVVHSIDSRNECADEWILQITLRCVALRCRTSVAAVLNDAA